MRTISKLALTVLALQLGSAAIAWGAESRDMPPLDTRGMTPFFEPATAGPKAPDDQGFLQRWLLLEPITKPNTSNTGFTGAYVRDALAISGFPGGTAAQPKAGTTVQMGGESLRWYALDAKLFDVKLFSFAQGLNKPVYGVIFWAETMIDSPREIRNIRLAVGSNSASMWWVNGEEAAGLFGDRRMVMDDVVSAPITLHKGRNIVRGAVINGPGFSDFCVRFIDENGQPVRDITTRLD